MGQISSLGMEVNELWSNCLKGISVIEEVPQHWHQYATLNSRIWSPLPSYNLLDYGFSKIDLLGLDRSALLGIYATTKALESANISIEKSVNKHRYLLPEIGGKKTGVIFGTGIGGLGTALENYAFQILSQFKSQQNVTNHIPAYDTLTSPHRLNPMVVPMSMPNAVSASIGIRFGIEGLNHTICHACASGTTSIGHAFQLIQSGSLDVAICGGTDYLYDYYGGTFTGFDRAGVLATPRGDCKKANRPFDKDRNGFLYSEGGAGALILESLEGAETRKANIVAEVIGFAETFDAWSMMGQRKGGEQVIEMHKKLLQSASVPHSSIGYINAHGTGTQSNDSLEAEVISTNFPHRPFVNSSKSLLGHTLGASGAIEAIITALSLKHQTLHPSINLDMPIDELNFTPSNCPQPAEIDYAMSQSFAFGGHNSGIVFRRWAT